MSKNKSKSQRKKKASQGKGRQEKQNVAVPDSVKSAPHRGWAKRVWLWLKNLSLIWKLIGIVVALMVLLLLTLPAINYTITRSVSVNPGVVVNSSDPFSALFELKNDGYVPISDVEYSYIIRDLDVGEVEHVLQNIVLNESILIPVIKGHGSTTINWDPLVASYGATSADIEITVSYRWEWEWWNWIPGGKNTQHYRFVTVQRPDGELVWTKRALSE